MSLGLEWKNVSYSVTVPGAKRGEKVTKQLLVNVNGLLEPGKLIAILGPSGAGKTTLLNILAGRIEGGTLSGSITLNGHHRSKKTWKRQTGYVEQEDIMYRTLTVRENLEYAARLRLGNNDSSDSASWTHEKKMERVNHVLRRLGLMKCADTSIGDDTFRGISGGERKRVSIGMELVTDPQILFLDEPTSGLDAFTALNVVEQCKQLTLEEGKCVLMTIHQPRTDILSLFDKILLLCQGGRVAFYGSLDEALTYFSSLGFDCPTHVNPADFFLDSISIDDRTDEKRHESFKTLTMFADTWAQRVAAAPSSEKEAAGLEAAESSDSIAELKKSAKSESLYTGNSWLTELGILLERNFKDSFRDKVYLGAMFFQTLFISIFLGCTFLQISTEQSSIQTRIGSLFFITTNLIFSVVQPLILVWPLERQIVMRERSSHSYRISAAFLSKSLSVLPLRLLASFVMATLLYFLLGYQLDGFKYGIFVAIVIAFTFCAQSLGLMIGSATPSVKLSQIVAPMIILMFLIYGGNIGSESSIPKALSWIQYISPIKYAYMALFQTEFSGLTFTFAKEVVDRAKATGAPVPGFTTGEQVIQLYEMDVLPVYACILIILGMGIVFQVLGFFALRKMTRPKLNLSI